MLNTIVKTRKNDIEINKREKNVYEDLLLKTFSKNNILKTINVKNIIKLGQQKFNPLLMSEIKQSSPSMVYYITYFLNF